MLLVEHSAIDVIPQHKVYFNHLLIIIYIFEWYYSMSFTVELISLQPWAQPWNTLAAEWVFAASAFDC